MNKKKENKDLNLDNFTWDDNVEDFFGIKATSENTEVEEAIQEFGKEDDSKEDKEDDDFEKEIKSKKGITKETLKEKDSKKEGGDKKEENVKEGDFFTDEEEFEKEDSFSFKSTVHKLKEKGILNFVELKDDQEIDEEVFEDLFETELEGRLNEEFSNFANSLDEDAKLFLEFKKNGGKTTDFLKAFENEDLVSDFESVDFNEDENKAENFLIEYYYQFEDMDEDEMNDKIDFLKERGRLGVTAERVYTKVAEKKKKEKETLLKKQEKTRKAQIDSQKKYAEDLKQVITETEVVGKIKINKKDKQELFNYLMSPSIRLEDGRKVTAFQKDLADVYQDKKMLIAFAKIIKDRFEISDLDVATKAVKQIKKTLRANSKSETRKSLADFF